MYISFITNKNAAHILAPAALAIVTHDGQGGNVTITIQGRKYYVDASSSILFGTLEQCIVAGNDYAADYLGHDRVMSIMNTGKHSTTPTHHRKPS